MIRTDMLITGLGAVSAAGNGLAETLGCFSRTERNAGPVTLFPTAMNYPVFEVQRLPEAYALEGRRTLGLALLAVDQALEDAGLGDLCGLRVGVCLGTTVASQLNDLQFYTSYRQQGSAPLIAVDRFLKGNLSEYIARTIGARGPSLTVVNACSSGTDAIGVALSWLKSDLCDLVIAGGADELNHIPYCGFSSLGILNPGLCAPFDRDRQGLNLGEGAGVMVVEQKQCATKRGKSSQLFLGGYGSQADAYHLTAPRPDGAGLRSSLARALSEAGIQAGQVAFVNAHGTGTQDNDLVEGTVLADLFGTDLQMLSTKGYTGHTLGAAGGLEAVFTALALREGWIPASAGFVTRDEAIPLAPLREKSAIDGDYAVSTSLAFGGNNAAIVMGRGGKP
ncbi:MAG: beta-ketoacyl-[acyl-carrier-protein] synthase family protein [Desulfuromonadales bacterium]|nr:beta-ketoacyl-[acyl-carrier-protein] synthase family protein [Desulfuromonadales bacterium]